MPNMPVSESPFQRLVEVSHAAVLDLYQQATTLTGENFRRAAHNQPPDLTACRPVAERLVAGMQQHPMDFMLLALRPAGTPSFLTAHPVNVAIILLELVRGDAAARSSPMDFCLLGLLHDVGIAQVEDIVMLPRRLTPEERTAMERHVTITHELLSCADNLSPEIIAAATQDHERLDGSGYPAKSRRKDLSRLGTLLAVTDIFEAMTHERPHQAARAPYVVLRELLSAGAITLEPEFLKLLVMRLGVYPVGSWVELSSHEIARVVETRPETPLRPLVEVVSAADRRLLAERRLVDLSAIPGVTIQRWLDEAALRRYVERAS